MGQSLGMTTGHFQKLPKSGCRSEPLLQVHDHGHGSRTILHRISGVFILAMKTLGSCMESFEKLPSGKLTWSSEVSLAASTARVFGDVTSSQKGGVR